MKAKSVRYDFFDPSDHDSNLGRLFNMVFDSLETARLATAPRTFEEFRESKYIFENAVMFHELCLTEMYLHSIINNLCDWKTKAEKYNSEFKGSWKYYASAIRLDVINEYGGEDEDYNDDGSVKTGVSNDVLKAYTIVSELADHDWYSIFLSTVPEDLYDICHTIIRSGSFSILDVFKNMGTPLKTYRQEDGEMVENTWVDESLSKAEKQNSYEMVADMLYGVLVAVRQLIDEVSNLDMFTDNAEFFAALPQRIQNIFDLKIQHCAVPGKEGAL